jgi:hypothetical protein
MFRARDDADFRRFFLVKAGIIHLIRAIRAQKTMIYGTED